MNFFRVFCVFPTRIQIADRLFRLIIHFYYITNPVHIQPIQRRYDQFLIAKSINFYLFPFLYSKTGIKKDEALSLRLFFVIFAYFYQSTIASVNIIPPSSIVKIPLAIKMKSIRSS